MINLIMIELNKFFKRKKNIITILMLFISISVYIYANISIDSNINKSKVDVTKEEIQSVKSSLDSLTLQYKTLQTPRLQLLISNSNTKLSMLQEKLNAQLQNDWKAELLLNLKLDNQLLSNIRQGLVISGEDTKVIEKRILLNQALYDKDIMPINEEQSMTSYNFIRLISRDFMPLLSIIIILLLSSDVVSIENDEGTFKFLLIQPISRLKIMLSKIISTSLLCILIIFGTLFVFFIILGIIKGFGSPNYPVEYYPGSLSYFLNNTNKVFNPTLIDIKHFILLIIPLNIILIIFVTSVGIFISTLIQNSTAAICTSIIAVISINIISNQAKLFSKLSQYLPLTYSNIARILDGSILILLNNKNITYINGVIILTISTLLFYILSILLFKKKDITC